MAAVCRRRPCSGSELLGGVRGSVVEVSASRGRRVHRHWSTPPCVPALVGRDWCEGTSVGGCVDQTAALIHKTVRMRQRLLLGLPCLAATIGLRGRGGGILAVSLHERLGNPIGSKANLEYASPSWRSLCISSCPRMFFGRVYTAIRLRERVYRHSSAAVHTAVPLLLVLPSSSSSFFFFFFLLLLPSFSSFFFFLLLPSSSCSSSRKCSWRWRTILVGVRERRSTVP